jgi:dimethylaniline monooxygenase (N-oxide forming)
LRNVNGMSAAYESLHINTDAKLMEYRDYPMPPGTPDYPSHRVIKAYFDDYADHFGLREHIRFRTEVTHARRRADGAWEITLDDGTTELFDVLVVANGHHWDPRWPEPAVPGRVPRRAVSFACLPEPARAGGLPRQARAGGGHGQQRHGYRLRAVAAGNRGAVVPVGAPRRVDPAEIPVRHPDVAPRYAAALVPVAHRQPADTPRGHLNAGTPWRFGLPRPDHRMLQAHPTISQEIFMRLGSGDILPRPGIRSLAGDRVEFTDGREEPVDVIFWCTGYKLSLPFFAPEFISRRPATTCRCGSGWSARHRQPVLRRPVAAARGDHADRRGTGPFHRRAPARPDRPAGCRDDATGDGARARRDVPPLPRPFASPHHAGGFRGYLHRLRKHARRGTREAERLGRPLPARATADAG